TKTISEGELLQLDIYLESSTIITEPVIGYQVQDRMGKAIFGENSVSSSHTISLLEPGHYKIHLEIVWPQVAPGEYGITLGLGDGLVADGHVVECWAHNVIALTSLKTAPEHGVF